MTFCAAASIRIIKSITLPIFLGALLAACGGDTFISISPATQTIQAGESVTLVASTKGTQIVWPASPPGTLAVNGNEATYTPPATPGRYDITVTARANKNKTATARIEVVPRPEMTAFSLPGLLPAVIDNDTGTITIQTQQWIDDLDALAAEFSATGTVNVAGAVQASGASSHDFHHEVEYTVTTGQQFHKTYTVQLRSPQTTGLPVIRIDTLNSEDITSKDYYLQTNIRITDPQNPDNDIEHVDFADTVKGRGNSTWTYSKKPYRLKFNKKISLFGLTKAKSWVLLANHREPTLMMNSITLELGQRLGMPFTNHYVHVELFLNGNYKGSYVLSEKIQVNPGRVDIDEDTGFLVELGTNFNEENQFRSNIYDLPVMIESPEDLEDPAGYDFVKNAMNGLEAALADPAFPDNGYRDLIDMDTFIDFLLVNEIVQNPEISAPRSVYMYKDAGGTIAMGPLWDFDAGFGWVYGLGSGRVYFAAPQNLIDRHPFIARIFEDPQFISRYRERWNQIRDTVAEMSSFISDLAGKLDRSQEQNYLRWPEAKDNPYDQGIAALLDWWNRRIDYLDTAINAME